MAVETIPNQSSVKDAFEHPIYSSDGSALPFSSLFDNHTESSTPPDRILVIFIRHFFCGNCQEYIRRLSSVESPFHPSHKSNSTTTTNFSKPAARPLPSVVIIGPGSPSLISTYIQITQCAFPVYSDPSTQLYDVLGMHRTLSLGHKAPVYIQHSLFSGAVKSAWQIVRRVGNGDATSGGDWNINGGEFLFVQPGLGSHRSKSRSPSRSATGRAPSSTRAGSNSISSSSSTLGWEITWCHRMLNSRDHTEINELHYNTCFVGSTTYTSSRATSPPRSILVNANRQAQPQRSHTYPTLPSTKGYSNECHGSCPGPDIPRSREEVNTHRSQSPAAAKHSSSRSRSRSTSTGASTIASLTRPRSSASRASTHRRTDSKASATTVEAQPRKSFSEFVGKVGGLVRSKSLSAKSSARKGTEETLQRRPSTRSTTSRQHSHRPRISLNLSRTKSISRSNTEPALPTSTPPNRHPDPISRSDTEPSIPAAMTPPPDVHDDPALKSTIVDSLVPAPLRPRSRSRPRSHSRTRSSRKGDIEMDENGIMIVDGVEFVNVISVQARVDSTTSTKARPKASEMQQVQQIQRHPRIHNQGYTRGSVGLDLMTGRSVAARLNALSDGRVPPPVAARLTMSGLEDRMSVIAPPAAPAITTH